MERAVAVVGASKGHGGVSLRCRYGGGVECRESKKLPGAVIPCRTSTRKISSPEDD